LWWSTTWRARIPFLGVLGIDTAVIKPKAFPVSVLKNNFVRCSA